MLNWLMAFFQPSVDTIVADFDKMINKLDKAVDFHNRQAALHAELVDKHVALNNFASKEANRARSVAQKLEDLLK